MRKKRGRIFLINENVIEFMKLTRNYVLSVVNPQPSVS